MKSWKFHINRDANYSARVGTFASILSYLSTVADEIYVDSPHLNALMMTDPKTSASLCIVLIVQLSREL